MQKKNGSKTRGELFVEQIAWNAAAGAALAVMILVLLLALQWLDQVAPPHPADAGRGPAETQLARPALGPTETLDRTVESAAVHRPSG